MGRRKQKKYRVDNRLKHGEQFIKYLPEKKQKKYHTFCNQPLKEPVGLFRIDTLESIDLPVGI